MPRIHVLLADDHTLFRAGVRKLLEGIEDIEVVGEAGDGEEAIRLADILHPDVVLMDISMPGCGGVEATRRIKERLPDVQVLVLTIHKEEEYIRHLLRAGSLGYVLKDIALDELVHAIHSVHRGQMYLASSISKTMLDEYMRRVMGGYEDSGSPRLTRREQEVFALVKEGIGNKEIGDRLYISPRTVETHKQHIARKLGLRSVRELAQVDSLRGP